MLIVSFQPKKNRWVPEVFRDLTNVPQNSVTLHRKALKTADLWDRIEKYPLDYWCLVSG